MCVQEATCLLSFPTTKREERIEQRRRPPPRPPDTPFGAGGGRRGSCNGRGRSGRSRQRQSFQERKVLPSTREGERGGNRRRGFLSLPLFRRTKTERVRRRQGRPPPPQSPPLLFRTFQSNECERSAAEAAVGMGRARREGGGEGRALPSSTAMPATDRTRRPAALECNRTGERGSEEDTGGGRRERERSGAKESLGIESTQHI